MAEEYALPTALRRAREDDGDHITAASFSGEALAEADLSRLELRGVTFTACRFMDCDLSGLTLQSCRLERCLFSRCRLSDGDWQEVQVLGCKGEGCDFRHSRLRGGRWEDCLLRWTNWKESRWDGTALVRCGFQEAALSGLRTKGVILEECDLTGAELFRAQLAGVDLSGCTLDGIRLSEHCSELKGARIGSHQAAVVARILGIDVV